MSALDSGGELTPPSASHARPVTPGPAQTPRTSPVHPPTPGHASHTTAEGAAPTGEAAYGAGGSGSAEQRSRRTSARSRVAPLRGLPATLAQSKGVSSSEAQADTVALPAQSKATTSKALRKGKESAAKPAKVEPAVAPPKARAGTVATASPPTEAQAEDSAGNSRRRSLRVTLKRPGPGNRSSEQPETPVSASSSATPATEETGSVGPEAAPMREPKKRELIPRPKRGSQSGSIRSAASPSESQASREPTNVRPLPEVTEPARVAQLKTGTLAAAATQGDLSATAQHKFHDVLRELASDDEEEDETERPTSRFTPRARLKKQTRSGRTSTSSFARVAREPLDMDAEMAEPDAGGDEEDEDEASGDDYQEPKVSGSKRSNKRKHAEPSDSESEDDEEPDDDDDEIAPRKRTKGKGGAVVTKSGLKSNLSAKAKPFIPRTSMAASSVSTPGTIAPTTLPSGAKKVLGTKGVGGAPGKASSFVGRPGGPPTNRLRPSGSYSGSSTPQAQTTSAPKPRPKPNVSAFDSLMGISKPAPPTPAASSSKPETPAAAKPDGGDGGNGKVSAAPKDAARPAEHPTPSAAPQYSTRPSTVEMPVTQEQMDRKREVERKLNNDEEGRFNLLEQSEIMFSFEEEMKSDPLFQHLRAAFKPSRFGGGLAAARTSYNLALHDLAASAGAGVGVAAGEQSQGSTVRGVLPSTPKPAAPASIAAAVEVP